MAVVDDTDMVRHHRLVEGPDEPLLVQAVQGTPDQVAGVHQTDARSTRRLALQPADHSTVEEPVLEGGEAIESADRHLLSARRGRQ